MLPLCQGGADASPCQHMCTRFILKEDQLPNTPRGCRDCGHIESAHPLPQPSWTSIMDQAQDRIANLGVKSRNVSAASTSTRGSPDSLNLSAHPQSEDDNDNKAKAEATSGFLDTLAHKANRSRSTSRAKRQKKRTVKGKGKKRATLSDAEESDSDVVSVTYTRFGEIFVLPSGYAEGADLSNDPGTVQPWSTRSVDHNLEQQLRDYKLIVPMTGRDIDRIPSDMTQSQFLEFLRRHLPEVVAWVERNLTTAGFPFALLKKGRHSLCEHQVMGEQNGQSIALAISGSKSHACRDRTLYIVPKVSIPKSVWMSQLWSVDLPDIADRTLLPMATVSSSRSTSLKRKRATSSSSRDDRDIGVTAVDDDKDRRHSLRPRPKKICALRTNDDQTIDLTSDDDAIYNPNFTFLGDDGNDFEFLSAAPLASSSSSSAGPSGLPTTTSADFMPETDFNALFKVQGTQAGADLWDY